jgi:hypothetical protein
MIYAVFPRLRSVFLGHDVYCVSVQTSSVTNKLLHERLETMWVIVLLEVLIFLKVLQLK